MSSQFSALSTSGQETFDTGPLSWVIGEIRESLGRSKTALLDAVTQDSESQSTLLNHAKSYLHQAHGALQIVDVDGVAIITETVEDLIDRLRAGQLPFTLENAQKIERAYQALVEYLEELMAGAQPQPVRLFPYYRTLLEVRGAERIHPADLFFPNLSIRPQLPMPAPMPARIDYTQLRLRFEKALLPFLKTGEGEKAAGMVDIIAIVERAQTNQQGLAFWWVLHGFAEAVRLGQIASESYVKQLFGRINLQIRHLAAGSSSISERLLRDALFFIARAENPSPRVAQIRAVYQLDGAVPVDYEKKRYGQVNGEALAVAKEKLAKAKNIWSRIADDDAKLWQPFEQELKVIYDASRKLNAPALSKLLGELNGIARHAEHVKPNNALGLEIATCLLFVENTLDHINRLPDDFSARADMLTGRLLALVAGEQQLESAQWMDDLSRLAQQRQTVSVLANEMKASLRQVEKTLDEYFVDPAKFASLHQIDPILHQIQGVLAVLDQDDAMLAVQHTQNAVRRFAQPTEDGAAKDVAAERATLQAVAQNVGALGFFIEMLPQNFESAKNRFSFDAEKGTFRANPMEKGATNASMAVDVAPLEEGMAGEQVAKEATPSASSASEPESVHTVESDLLMHQQHSADLAASFAAEPDNLVLQEQLKESLQQVRKDAALLDNPELTGRAQAAIDSLDQPGFVASADSLSGIIATSTPALAMVLPSVVSPETDDAIDAELLEIFMSEAEEVLAFVQENIPLSRQDTHNQSTLTTIRRSFHTLKGSGRMVGLNVFAEAAASVEQVMNLWLAEARAGTHDLYALLDYVAEELVSWVDEIKANGQSRRTSTAIVNAADRVKASGVFSLEAPADVAPTPTLPVPPAVESPQQPVTTDETVEAFETAVETIDIADQTADHALADFDFDLDTEAISQPLPEPVSTPGAEEILASLMAQAEEVEALPVGELVDETAVELIAAIDDAGQTEVIDIADLSDLADALDMSEAPVLADGAEASVAADATARVQNPDDNIKSIGTLEISMPLFNIYLAETDQIVRLLAQDFSEWRHEAQRAVAREALHAAHSLGGSSATVGFNELQEVAHALEMVLQSLTRRPVLLVADDYDLLDQCIDCIRSMLQTFALGELPPHEPEMVARLGQLQQDIELRPGFTPEHAASDFDVGLDDVDAELPRDLDEPMAIVPSRESDGGTETMDLSIDGASPDDGIGDDLGEALELITPASDEAPSTESLEASLNELLESVQESALEMLPDVAPDIAVADPSFDSALELIPAAPSEISLDLLADVPFAPSLDLLAEALAEPSLDLLDEAAVDTSLDMLPEALPEPSLDMLAEALAEPSLDLLTEAPVDTSLDMLIEAPFPMGAEVPLAAALELPADAPAEELPLVQSLEASLEALLEAAQQTALDDAVGTPPTDDIALEAPADALQDLLVSDTDAPAFDAIADIAPPSDLLGEPAETVDPAEPASAPQAAMEARPLSVSDFPATASVAPTPAPVQETPITREGEVVVETPNLINDELDADLLPVFIEEGRDLLPQAGQALRSWKESPADTTISKQLLRLLHTIKGSARMAGAMRLGQHAHEIETRIENIMHLGPVSQQSFDELLAHYDHIAHLFELLQNPAAAVPEPAAVPVTAVGVLSAESATASAQTPAPARTATAAAASAAPVPSVPLVRVRADILDRLVNQAGEVSIARSKLENQIGLLRQSLSELTENITRLRGQLREVEIQAESQISSRLTQAGDRVFDPLEFDRFSRLQELTRGMAESVNDVASVQDTLTRTVDGATTDLLMQARLTRELQQDLMRVRMVPFSSISERLYRVTRQAAKETDKRVNLDIRGTAVEIDRSVLEKMAGPFEHLLRNAIVHGIETREQRRAAGKNEVGEMLVEIRQEGNEVAIHFTDDGAGLDLARIRAKARAVGLIAADAHVSDSEASDLIFEPGFTTATVVTELAGRGVGMDVVRSEASGLGGRVEVESNEGRGAHFTIHLPLTLAVTQVVLLSTGGKTYAVPSVLVEQVQQLKSAALESAYGEASILWQGSRVPMHYLSTLLGDHRATPVAQRYSPILILKSGNERVAIHVDEVMGNREVVVKNIGPQLSRMIGIAGATVLGSGNIVLILNPVPLAHRYANEAHRGHGEASAATGGAAAPVVHGPLQEVAGVAGVADARLAADPQAVGKAPEVNADHGMRKMSVVMVVDDSLTVRKVTQRFLVREGYQVVLAKDGVDALEQLQSITPDVMLVDIEMPRMDGFDLTRNVRGDERTVNTPIIMITSRTADKHRNYALELGVNAYFGKPFQEDKLLEAIAGFVKKGVPA